MHRPWSVRRAVEKDADAVAALLQAAFAPLRDLYTPAAFAATTPTATMVAARFHEGPVWVAESEGAFLGTVAAVPRPGALYVRSMAVVPAARGRGVGAALLDAVERHARANGVRRLELSTTPFLHAATRLYERAGFRRTAAGPRDLEGTPLVTMAKRLDAGG